MSDNNNIEDFFNNSLDGFNQEPRERVWEGLNERLDTPPTIWRTPLFWGLTSAALLLSAGILGYFAYAKINSLSKQNKFLSEQKLNLENDLKDCSGSVKSLESSLIVTESKGQIKFSNLMEDNRILAVKLETGKSEIAYLKGEVQKHKLDRKDSKSNLNSTPIFTNKDLKNQLEDSYTQNFIIKSRLLQNQPQILKSGFELTSKRIDKNKKNHLQTIKVNTNRNEVLALRISRVPTFSPSLKFGTTGGAFTTFTDLNSTQELGWNVGMSLQFQVFKNVGITGEIRYNYNEYGVSLDTDNQSVTTSFPHARLINRNIKIVTVANHYFDLPIGLKFNKKIERFDGSIYFNPGVAWQLFLPQRFGYDTDAEYISLREERYFAYFGSAFLNLGFEKKINQNLAYQLGIWGEKGLVKYGVEGRNMAHLGIRGTILFGK